MPVILTGILLFCFVYKANSQYLFNKRFTYNSEKEFAKGVAVMPDSAYMVLTASTNNKMNTQGLILYKVSQQGDTLWHREYVDTTGFLFQGELGSLIRTFDNCYVSTGSFAQQGTKSDAILAKFKPNGDTVFLKKLNHFPYADSLGEAGYYCTQTSDSGFAIVGEEEVGSNSALPTILAMKTDKNGNVIWHKNFGGTEVDYAESVSEIPGTKNLIIGGHKGGGYSQTPWLITVDSMGNLISQKLITSGAMGCGADIFNGLGGDYTFDSCLDTVIDSNNDVAYPSVIGLLNSELNFKWKKSLIKPGWSGEYEGIFIVRQISDSGVVAVGSNYSDSSGRPRGWIIKFDKNGNQLWEHFYKTDLNQDHYFADFHETPDKGFIVTGTAWGDNIEDTWLIKLDSNGCFEPGCLLNTGTLEVKPSQAELSIFPNPNNGTFKVFTSTAGSLLTIYNLTGQQVYADKLYNNRNDIDLSNQLPSGMYICRVIQAGNKVSERKLMVIK